MLENNKATSCLARKKKIFTAHFFMCRLKNNKIRTNFLILTKRSKNGQDNNDLYNTQKV